ncbi:MAG: hypothetical protein ACLFNU_01730 [Bacteroidales bacterium]
MQIGCSDGTRKGEFSEGHIEYNITYIDNHPPKYDTNLRPNKMVVKFKDNNTINKIEGLSGALSFAFIQDIESKSTHTMIKLLNKNLLFFEPIYDDRYPFAYDDMPEFTISRTNDTIEVQGFKCRRAIATYNDSLLSPFEILYTKDIAVANPNYNTPFDSIDGVMLKFSVTLFNQNMQVEANSVKATKVSDDEFTIPADFEKINEETLKDVIELFQ